MVASGIGGFIASLSAVDSLALARDRFYEQGRFADVFATLKRAPDTLLERLREVPGVTEAEATVEATARHADEQPRSGGGPADRHGQPPAATAEPGRAARGPAADAVRASPGLRVVIERWGGPAVEGRVRRVEPAAFTKVSALGIEEQRVKVLIDMAACRLEAGKARLHAMEVGARNATLAWVRQGLAPGQTVVVCPPAALADGRKVRVRRP